MSENSRGLELRVGMFVAAGLAIIAVMAVQFGRLGQGLESYYKVTVELPDAGGILNGSDVLLSGARIGSVIEKPQISDSITAVRVVLSIREGVPLPKATEFTVESAGLLGDRFIKARLPKEFDAAKFDANDPAQRLNDGDVAAGSAQSGGLNELAAKGQDAVADLREGLAKIQVLTERLNTELLSQQNMDNLSSTFANLKTTSENFSRVSKDLEGMVANINGVVAKADTTVAGAGATMKTASLAAEDLRRAISDAREVLGAAQNLVANAQEGPGLLGALLNDQKLREDLNALVENLRKHGVLFYRDSTRTIRPAEAIEAGRNPNSR